MPKPETALWSLSLCLALLGSSAEAFFRDAEIRQAVLSPSWQRLAVILARSGSPDGAPGLFAVNANGSKFRPWVNRYRHMVIDARAKNSTLEGNHHLPMVPEPKPGESNKEVLVGETTWKNRCEVFKITPLWLNVRTGSTRTTDHKEPYGALGWIFESKGEPRVVFTQEGNRKATDWRGHGQSAWELLTEGTRISLDFVPKAVDDAGRFLVLQTQARPAWR